MVRIRSVFTWVTAATITLGAVAAQNVRSAPRVSAPSPRVSTPAPRMSTPAPRMSAPTPRISTPTPRASTPAPRYTPPPSTSTPAPRYTPTPSRSTPTPRYTPTPSTPTPAPRYTPTPRVSTPAPRSAPAPVGTTTSPRVSVPSPRYTPAPVPTQRASPTPVDRTSPGARPTPTAGPRFSERNPEPTRPTVGDSSARLRDLYSRRDTVARPEPTPGRIGGAERRTPSLTPRYESRLPDVAPVAPGDATRGRVTPVGPRPGASPTPVPRPGSGNSSPRIVPTDPGRAVATPRTGTPAPRAQPITPRYPVPGRPTTGTPRAQPTPGVAPELGRPNLRPGTPGTVATPRPTASTPRVRPTPRPTPGDVTRSTRTPTLNSPGYRTGGGGASYSDHWNNYNGWSAAGSSRYLYGSYHWSAHSACFSPCYSSWGWYAYPYQYCGSWSNYWYNCSSSFGLYWNSCGPVSFGISFGWPGSCYLPGSYIGYYGFGSWCDSYADWTYRPPIYVVVEGSSPSASGAAPAVEVPAEGAAPAADAAPAAAGGVPAALDESAEIENLAIRHMNLGDYYFKQGRYEEAAESYVRATTYAPNDGALHFVLADALFAQGDYHYAAYMLGKALILDPGLAKADADKRTYYDDPKRFDAQLARLRTYLEEKPYDAAGHLVLGYSLRFSGDPEGATKAFNRVLEIDPGNQSARAFLDALSAAPLTTPPTETAGEAKRD